MAFHVIKENDLFYLSDVNGNIPQSEQNYFGYGLYTKDTRILSNFSFGLSPDVLVPLDADISNNYKGIYRYTNKELVEEGTIKIPREVLLVTRKQMVDGKAFFEEVSIQNYSKNPIELKVNYHADADFLDMFQVRGFASKGLVNEKTVVTEGHELTFSYVAQDGVESHIILHGEVINGEKEDTFFTVENDGTAFGLSKQVTVGARSTIMLIVAVHFNHHTDRLESTLSTSEEKVKASYQKWGYHAPQVFGNQAFQTWYQRGLSDIRMLLTDIGYGPFPVAGVPWFAVPFGRDSLITAFQLLSAHPEVAKGTLRTMAAFQGEKVDSWRDEQPGKIMHELRSGEVTRIKELPFGPYYGTIDATPLFLILAAEYLSWTGDNEFIKEILPNVERAFEWIEKYGDRDGDGFVEYYQEASKGLANQGWKDSGDSNVHRDGTLATGPIALSEVQAYTYRAYKQWSDIFSARGNKSFGQSLSEKAKNLQAQFIKAFWMEDEDAVALALDGEKNRVASVSSNAGQVLWGGILPKDYAYKLITRILQDDMFNGFGIRTLSSKEVGYNPLSYHNGSIWAHDNSLILSGMQGYGHKDAVRILTSGLLKTASHFPLMRLPELFTGFGESETIKPIPYPVSCSPQAWAAGTPILALQAILGLVPDCNSGTILLNPILPDGIDEMQIEDIQVGHGMLAVLLQKTSDNQTTLCVTKNTTGLRIQIK
jgi:glycogen debranching enzyme